MSEYDDDDEVILRRVKRKGRRILSSKIIGDEECKLNLTSIIFSCGSSDALELVAECPRLTQIRSGKNIFILIFINLSFHYKYYFKILRKLSYGAQVTLKKKYFEFTYT